MCAVFGLIDYNSALSTRAKEKILKVLSKECETRGTDATGFAFNNGSHITVYKRPQPAHKVKLRLPENVKVVMGHTRLSTQGSEKLNFNNHPFIGRTKEGSFALAHNGVLSNDELLRKTKGIPKSLIETDSYIAVQLLEQAGELNFDSLRNMAEDVIIENLAIYLDNTSVNAAEAVRSAIIDGSIEVVSRSDFDIESGKESAFFDGKHIYFMPKAMEKIAGDNGVDYRAFISELKSADVLRIVDGKSQIPVTVNGRSVRAICVPGGKIFGFGEIGLNEERFESEPEIKIEIGETDGKKLFFALKDKTGNENGHGYVCGPSASGKSTFLIGVANRALASGMNVISVGYEYSVLEVGEVLTVTRDDLYSEGFWEIITEPGAAYTLIPDDEIKAEEILLRLYTYKAKSEKRDSTLLILDEVQTLDCGQTGVLSSCILRQGRKFGILAFLASQYLTAEDARNVDKALKQCTTKIAFAPGREASVASMLGVSTTDKEARRRLEDIERYSFAAKGALATDKGFVRTAVIAKSPAV